MNQKYKNVVWDWNGTLLDDVLISHRTINLILARRGLREISLQDYRDTFGFPVREYYEKIGFDFERDDWHEVSLDFVETYNTLLEDAQLTDGVYDVLQGIQERGVNQYILSALQEDLLQDMVTEFGLDSYFEQVCGGTDIYANGKEDRGFKMLSDYPRLLPKETIMVGDTLHDAEVAQALGFDFVLYAGGHNSEWRLRKSGSVIRKMKELL